METMTLLEAGTYLVVFLLAALTGVLGVNLYQVKRLEDIKRMFEQYDSSGEPYWSSEEDENVPNLET